MSYKCIVLFNGFSRMTSDDEMLANCSCTLIKGPKNIVVDTMTPWDGDRILQALGEHGLHPDNIHYVVSTHGHSDHIGNNNLFLKATHIVGHCISFKDSYKLNTGTEYAIDSCVRIIHTPGHTLSDVTVLVTDDKDEVVAITGDLFECQEDIEDPDRWLSAGSEAHESQRCNRSKIAAIANWIVPGHGPMFQVTPHIRDTLQKQIKDK